MHCVHLLHTQYVQEIQLPGLDTEESLLAASRLTIKDALLERNERLRAEAWRWLWMVAPGVAQRVDA